ncbi:MAG: hypothetical protein STHCBS139747_005471 [Sporothrix thermara]
MPRGFMLYVSAAAVGLLGFGQPVPAEASDASQASAVTAGGHDTSIATVATPVASDAASSIASSISLSSSSRASSAKAPISSTTPSISVTITPSSSSSSSSSSAFSASSSSSSPSPSSSSSTNTLFFDTDTCQSKTINYITHTLPQQCLRTSWSSANATTSTSTVDAGASAATGAVPAETATAAAAGAGARAGNASSDADGRDAERKMEKEKEDDANQEDLATGSFMSFEEWKVLQLKKAGQDPAELQARRRQQQQHQHQLQHQRANQYAHGAGGDVNIDSIGDDGEIALDFDVLNEKVSEMAGSASAQMPGHYYEGGSGSGGYRQDGQASGGGGDRGGGGGGGSGSGGTGGQDDALVYADGAAQYYRSKDAGKTGKERFSFASFDAGATILKTNKGVKNAKAILVENKDSYMLLECRTPDKHVIVEMSDDILVDTVVLANFEFFSSMVRRFRVSVSDRYPVKADRWRTLGEFEARNSRDIQPFLIEHPQIWAKYIRIDFLTHYGSEYYCPISLLRVHGTRMLDSWKDTENGRDDDDELDHEHLHQHGHGQYSQQQQHHHQPEPEPEPEPVQEQPATKHTEEHVARHPEEHYDEQKQAEAVQHGQLAAEKADSHTAGTGSSLVGYTAWSPVSAYFSLSAADSVCMPFEVPARADTHSAASDASQYAAVEAKDGNNSNSQQSQFLSAAAAAAAAAATSSTFSTAANNKAESHSTPAHNAAKDAASPPSSPFSATSQPSNPSASSDASFSSSSSDPATRPSAAAVAASNNAVAAAASLSGRSKTAATHRPQSASGNHGSQRTPPTTTVQTSHYNKHRGPSGGSGSAGGPSQASGSAYSGSGSNQGAAQGSGGSSSSVGSNSNNNNNNINNNNNNNNNNVNNNSGGGSASGSPGGTPSPPPPPPVVQESFFKSITKRLQLLESNTSLSMQYIEDQSRFLQDALRKMERKQISRVDSFLDTLNNTVLSELRNMRQQYDQIWQSTVIALETQREQNQRETVALSDRLNVLADEVVFQKRMAILQSVLLLCCLALVIFSRGLLSGAGAGAGAAAYMPMSMPLPVPMPMSPVSPPSASSSVGIRSNLRSLRNNLRNPYATYNNNNHNNNNNNNNLDGAAQVSGYPLSTYSAGSPPGNGNLRVPVGANNRFGGNSGSSSSSSGRTPGSPESLALPGPQQLSNESQDSLVEDLLDPGGRASQERSQGMPLAAAAANSPVSSASLRLSDIEEVADQSEENEDYRNGVADGSEDRDDATVTSEATLVGHPGSKAGDNFDDDDDDDNVDDNDNIRPFTPHAVSDDGLGMRKRLPPLPEQNSD